MNLIDPIIQELTHEAGVTRKTLERIPDGDWEWTPHEKSMGMGKLASHIADTPSWVDPILTKEELAFDPESHKPWIASGKAEVLEVFDKNLAQALTAMKGVANEALMVTWSLKAGDKVLLSMPRIAVLRAFILSHMIHHRAQLGVYLRLRDVLVPQMYGPSADEPDSPSEG